MKVAEPTSLAEGNAALLRLAMLRREGAVPLAEQLARVVEISARTLGVDRAPSPSPLDEVWRQGELA